MLSLTTAFRAKLRSAIPYVSHYFYLFLALIWFEQLAGYDTFSSTDDLSYCFDQPTCPAGDYLEGPTVSKNGTCADCAQGRFSQAHTLECKSCEAGLFQNETGTERPAVSLCV